MNLYLIRHAAAEEPGAGPDSERRLTDPGRAQAREAAAEFRNRGVVLAGIVSSPLARAAETARIIAAELTPSPVVDLSDLLAGDATLEEIRQLVRFRQEVEHLALVGHQPDLGRLAVGLLGQARSAGLTLRPSGIIALDAWNGPTWGTARLEWVRTA